MTDKDINWVHIGPKGINWTRSVTDEVVDHTSRQKDEKFKVGTSSGSKGSTVLREKHLIYMRISYTSLSSSDLINGLQPFPSSKHRYHQIEAMQFGHDDININERYRLLSQADIVFTVLPLFLRLPSAFIFPLDWRPVKVKSPEVYLYPNCQLSFEGRKYGLVFPLIWHRLLSALTSHPNHSSYWMR